MRPDPWFDAAWLIHARDYYRRNPPPPRREVPTQGATMSNDNPELCHATERMITAWQDDIGGGDIILSARDATHVQCGDCGSEEPLGDYALSYDAPGCEHCGGWAVYRHLRATALRSEEADEDYLRDRKDHPFHPGGKRLFVYEVIGEAID